MVIDRKVIEKAFRASAAKLITETTFETNWNVVSAMFMFSDEAEKTFRLYQSQTFRDPDYPDRVLNFFESASQVDSERTNSMIIYVIEDLKKQQLLNDDEIQKLPIAKLFLENKEYAKFAEIIAKSAKTKYLDVKELPDDFYYNLVDTLNNAFAFGIYDAVNILARKLLENLLVDILRKKFGMKNIDIFYDKSHCRFQSFNVLLKNFADKMDEFKTVVTSIDADFVLKLNGFREVGNSSAHTLEVQVKEKDLMTKKDDLEFATKLLVRLFNNITSTS